MGIDMIDMRLDTGLCALGSGPRNLITDVPGVRVGHVTLCDRTKGIHTGVTAIVPPGDCFMDKFPAAQYVSNGFGKSMGLVQVQELGTLETPILLTNTFACGAGFDALVDDALSKHAEIGVSTSTVNPVVLECNDGSINRIRNRVITARDGREAVDRAREDFEEGDVGAGTGMTCFGLKGGIGSASGIMRVDGHDYVLGMLVMTNFGSLECLRIAGRPIGAMLSKWLQPLQRRQDVRRQDVALDDSVDDSVDEKGGDVGGERRDMGSIVAVIATDMPLDSRQLHRLSRRVTVGIARCGGYIGDGSGEIVVSFSTANRMRHWMNEGAEQTADMIETVRRLNEHGMDDCFRAVASLSEEAIISSLLHAHSVIGWTGEKTMSLRDAADEAGMRISMEDDSMHET